MVHRLTVVGAGGRGWNLAKLAARHPDRAEIWAVADPAEPHRTAFADEFSIAPDRCFEAHQELLSKCLDLDGIFVTTPVSSHAEVACDCLEAHVPVFLEKPMALNVPEAGRIVQTAERTGTPLQVGFNLRYSPFYMRLKEIIDQGQLGRMLSIEWKEALAPNHWAEYCRHPTYNRRAALGSWLLEKSCHDVDMINWIVDAPCVRVASFGSRSHFNPRPDVPERCSEQCPIEGDCIFSARRLYEDMETDATGQRRDMPHTCVYHSDSDLVDHQTAMLEYANGVTVAFSLLPLTHLESRYVHICGSQATLRGRSVNSELRVHPYLSGKQIVCDPAPVSGGHGGSDQNIVEDFLDWLDEPNHRPKATIIESLEAMVVACGIDLAMREHRVVELEELRLVTHDEESERD